MLSADAQIENSSVAGHPLSLYAQWKKYGCYAGGARGAVSHSEVSHSEQELCRGIVFSKADRVSSTEFRATSIFRPFFPTSPPRKGGAVFFVTLRRASVLC